MTNIPRKGDGRSRRQAIEPESRQGAVRGRYYHVMGNAKK
jgi:hypothetical protein